MVPVALDIRDLVDRWSHERLAILAAVSELLLPSLDYDVALGQVAELAVPKLADFCAVCLVRDPASGLTGGIDLVAVHHEEPEKTELARSMFEEFPPSPDANHGVGLVARTAQSDLVVEITEGLLVASAASDRHLDMMRQLGWRSLLSVPLVARDQVLGVLTLAMDDPERTLTEDDLQFAELVARRASTAIDRARLYDDIRDQLDHSVRRSRDVIESAHEAYVAMDERGVVTEWNPAAEQTFGYTRAEAMGRTVAGLVVPDHKRADHTAGFETYKLHGAHPVIGKRLEITAQHRDGHPIPIEITISAFDGESAPEFHAFLHDISDRRKAAEMLRQQSTELAQAQRIAHVGNWIWEMETGEVTWSDELYRIHGLEPQSEPITLATATEFMHPEDREVTRAHTANMVRGEAKPHSEGITYRIRRRDGEERWCYGLGEVEHDESGKPVRVRGIVQDITEAHLAEQRTRDFFAMASHELRTPLTAVAGFATTLLDRWDSLSDDDRRSFIGIIDTQSARLSRLVNDVLMVSRIDSDSLARPSETARIAEAVAATATAFEDVMFEVDVDPELTVAVADDHLQQVLFNLVGNARLHGAPPVTIRARPVDDQDVILEVCDSGPGVSPEFAPKLFEKFSQEHGTGSSGGGSGLGLSIVAGIASAYGGEAWYEPNTPSGACFSVRLPGTATAAP
jgi:PAS domain S-box-containing protein